MPILNRHFMGDWQRDAVKRNCSYDAGVIKLVQCRKVGKIVYELKQLMTLTHQNSFLAIGCNRLEPVEIC